MDNASAGAAWVFTRSGTTWTAQGGKLTGTGATGAASLGSSVALSGDGNTAVAGGPNDTKGKGAAWVYTRSGTTWTQQGGKLTGAGEIGNGLFGYDVAASGDGNTALIAASTDDGSKGALFVFTRAGTTWTQQGNKLTGAGETGPGQLGFSVALSTDGNTAVGGAHADDSNRGAAFVFTRSGSTWTQLGSKLTGDGATARSGRRSAAAIALSPNGLTLLVGGPLDTGLKGAVWVFSGSPPNVLSITPTSGPAGGGTLVKISGLNLTPGTAVKFGGVDATLVKAISDGELSAVAPPGTGTVDVLVTTVTGTSAATAASRFTYTGAAPPPSPIGAHRLCDRARQEGRPHARRANAREREGDREGAPAPPGRAEAEKSFAGEGRPERAEGRDRPLRHEGRPPGRDHPERGKGHKRTTRRPCWSQPEPD